VLLSVEDELDEEETVEPERFKVPPVTLTADKSAVDETYVFSVRDSMPLL